MCSVALPASDQHQTTRPKCLQLHRTDVGSLKRVWEGHAIFTGSCEATTVRRLTVQNDTVQGDTVQDDTVSLNTTDNFNVKRLSGLSVEWCLWCVCLCVCLKARALCQHLYPNKSAFEHSQRVQKLTFTTARRKQTISVDDLSFHSNVYSFKPEDRGICKCER